MSDNRKNYHAKEYMIPKVIHYCWFGDKVFPDEYKKYISSWKKFCPDYEIKIWNESNFDVLFCDFAKEAYEEKKWAFLSDCVRLKIIYDEGGIYLDTDVELVKNLDRFLSAKCFFGTEPSGFVATGLGFGAEKGNSTILEMLHQYDGHFKMSDGSFDMKPCPQKNTDVMVKKGYVYNKNRIWKKDGIVIYPPRYFCPMDYDTGVVKLTEDTYSIHHYGASWHTIWLEIMYRVRRFCLNKFGNNKGEKIARVVNLPFMVFNKIAVLGIKNFGLWAINKISK